LKLRAKNKNVKRPSPRPSLLMTAGAAEAHHSSSHRDNRSSSLLVPHRTPPPPPLLPQNTTSRMTKRQSMKVRRLKLYRKVAARHAQPRQQQHLRLRPRLVVKFLTISASKKIEKEQLQKFPISRSRNQPRKSRILTTCPSSPKIDTHRASKFARH